MDRITKQAHKKTQVERRKLSIEKFCGKEAKVKSKKDAAIVFKLGGKG